MVEQEKKTVDIGQKIYEIRKSEGLSQTEFAEKFHVTRQTVSNWEHGKNYPDMETLMRISDEYGITFDELIKKDKGLIQSIDRSRRVAFKSMLLLTLIGVTAIVAILMKLMPEIVSAFYYDPEQTVAVYTDNAGYTSGTSRLEADARVYGELYLPVKRYDIPFIEDLGFGKYEFTLIRTLYTDRAQEPEEISGRIERNRFMLYEPSLYRRPDWDPNWHEEETSLDKMKEDVETLDDNKDYISYITFKEAIGWEDACKWMDENGGSFHWAGIVTDKEELEVIGLYIVSCGEISAFDAKKYPYLFGYGIQNSEAAIAEPLYNEAHAKTHFISMMKYMADHPEYTVMQWGKDLIPDKREYSAEMNKMIKYIESNGLQVYGMTFEANKEDLFKALSDKNVSSIKVEAYY